MGISGFGAFLRACGIEPKIVDMKTLGKVILIVDLLNLYYKSVKTKNKFENEHIQVIFNFVAYVCRFGITPIFVFDGKPPLAKGVIIAQRKARLERRAIAVALASPILPAPQSPRGAFVQLAAMVSPIIDEMMMRLGCGSKSPRVSPMRRESPAPTRITAASPVPMACMSPPPMAIKPVPVADAAMREKINDIKKMLDFLKIPHVSIVNGEAEPVCAKLVADSRGAIRFVLSDDYDLVALGVPVLRNLNFRLNTAEYLHPDDIRERLGLTKEQMIDLFIMFSTEYRPIFAKCTKLEILAHLKAFGTLEGVAQHIATVFPNVQIPDAAEIAERRGAFDVSKIQHADESRHFEHISKFANCSMNPPMNVLQKYMEKACPSLSPHLVNLKLKDIYYFHGD